MAKIARVGFFLHHQPQWQPKYPHQTIFPRYPRRANACNKTLSTVPMVGWSLLAEPCICFFQPPNNIVIVLTNIHYLTPFNTVVRPRSDLSHTSSQGGKGGIDSNVVWRVASIGSCTPEDAVGSPQTRDKVTETVSPYLERMFQLPRR